MRVLLLDGGRAGESATGSLRETLVALLRREGADVSAVTLRDLRIAPCRGCFECWVKTPGECVIRDSARDVTRQIIASDVVVYLTPVTFGGYSSELKKVLDRSICLIAPFFTRIGGEVHHKARYARYPRLVALGVDDSGDRERESVFVNLVRRNAVNMHAPGSAAAVAAPGTAAEQVEERFLGLLREAGAVR